MYTFCSGQAVAGALPEAGATPAGERISARRLVGLLEAVMTLGYVAAVALPPNAAVNAAARSVAGRGVEVPARGGQLRVAPSRL
jgi:hypothetical protein